ncbi:hypothetical protein HZB01_00650 [Candidatus Woesearchaeota archaeon]|nr:hypothetical protein [Candidatus Woesearchaeota archaeon]
MAKKENGEKIEQVHIYLTPWQKKSLEGKAEEIGISLSSYIKVRLFQNDNEK